MKGKPLWLTLVLAVLVGCCLGATLFWGWFNFRSDGEAFDPVQPTISLDDGDAERSEGVATRITRPTDVVVQITSTPQPEQLPTSLPQVTETAVIQQQQQQPSPTIIPPTTIPTIIIPTEMPQAEASQADVTNDSSNVLPTTQTVSFAEAEFATFISQQASSLGLELVDTQAEFASGQGTITGDLNTFGIRMGTQLDFTLVAESGEPKLTVTNGTIGSQPMPRQIVEQIEEAFEQGVKSGLQTNGEVYIDSIQMDDGLITVTYSQ